MTTFSPPIDDNIQGYNVDPNATIEYVRKKKPRGIVIANDIDLAIRCRQASPGTRVLFRFIPPKLSDADTVPGDNHHLKYKVAAWIEMHQRFEASLKAHGIWLYVNNEPYGYEPLRPLDRWTAAIIRHYLALGVKVCVLNFATGHPEEGRWAELQDTLLLASQNPEMVAVGLHEYGGDTMVEGGRVGRFRALIAFCRDVLRIRCPLIFITEWGVDAVPGKPGRGYLSRNITPADYMAMLIVSWRIDYEPYVEVVFVCLYGYTNHPDWWDFRYDDQPAITEGTKGFLMPDRPVAQAVLEKWERRILTLSVALRLRTAPNTTSSTVVTLQPGAQPVDYNVNGDVPDTAADAPAGREWFNVRLLDGKIGYVRSDYAALALPSSPPPPPPLPPPPPPPPPPDQVVIGVPEWTMDKSAAVDLRERLLWLATEPLAQRLNPVAAKPVGDALIMLATAISARLASAQAAQDDFTDNSL